MKEWIQRWGPAVLLMLVIFAASATAGSTLPKFGIIDIFVKKGGHMMGYALLSASYFHALNNGRRSTKRVFLLAVLFAVLYAISDEIHQRFTPGRTPSPLDVCIDATGSCIGLALWHFLRTRFRNPFGAARVKE